MIHLIFIDLLKSEYFVIYFSCACLCTFQQTTYKITILRLKPASFPFNFFFLSSFSLFCFYSTTILVVLQSKYVQINEHYEIIFFFCGKKFELIGVLCENIWIIYDYDWLIHNEWCQLASYDISTSRVPNLGSNIPAGHFFDTIFG